MNLTTILLILAVVFLIAFVATLLVAFKHNAERKQLKNLCAEKTRECEELDEKLRERSITITQLQEVIREYEDRIVVLTDDIPAEDSPYNRGLKMSNEIVPYISVVGDKIRLLVYNNKGVTPEDIKPEDGQEVIDTPVPEPEKPEVSNEKPGKEDGTHTIHQPEAPDTDDHEADGETRKGKRNNS